MHPVLAAHEATARQRLTEEALGYFATGAASELTLAEAVASWSRYRLRPRVLRDVAQASVAATVLGAPVASPVGVAPTAFHTLAHPEGEIATARGAAAAGSLFVLSARATSRIEDVAAVAGQWWFQVYYMRDRALTHALVDRAAAAGAQALVLTGDTPYLGPRYRGARLPARRADALVNVGEVPEDSMEQDPSITLDAIGELSERTGLPVVVKGVLRGDDAQACVEAGAAAVWVSTHGGRQTDRAVSAAWALPEVVGAVGSQVEVYADGGIRSGIDALVALGLGARAVFLGRPVLWALTADGADGVRAVLDAVSEELRHTMAVAGFASPGDLDGAGVVVSSG